MEDLVDLIPGHFLIVGPTASGKSQLVVEALRGPFRKKFNIVVLICPTYANNKTYEGFAHKDPNFLVFAPNNSAGEIDTILQECSIAFENYGQVLLILDDCACSDDVKKRHSSTLLELAFSGRHRGFSVWLLTQQYTSVAKAFRENVASTITFYSPSDIDAKMLWDNYGGDTSKEDRQQLQTLLKNNLHARLCWRLRFPFTVSLEIPPSRCFFK